MDHQPLRRKYGSIHHPILEAKCALTRPADDVETRSPGIGKTLLLERYVWWQLKAGLAFHFGRSFKKDHKVCADATVEEGKVFK